MVVEHGCTIGAKKSKLKNNYLSFYILCEVDYVRATSLGVELL